MKHGVLLINLGTPDNTEYSSILRYLREFLSDKRVIQCHPLLRYLLLYGIILPFRTKKTQHAYQSIWTKQGSPLRVHSESLRSKVQEYLGPKYQVALGMRYGNPGLELALDELRDCEHLTIVPLYPQYASATSGSSLAKVFSILGAQDIIPGITTVPLFYQNTGFIQAQSELIQPYLDDHDYILFSYHGVPEQHLASSGCPIAAGKPCAGRETCKLHPDCYRAQCLETTRSVARNLNLSESKHGSAFQSRLGRTPWIKPYTDMVLGELIDLGVKRLAVTCPSFVVDCLETVEEIGIRAQEQWLKLGGTHFTLIPCMNDHPRWIKALADIIC